MANFKNGIHLSVKLDTKNQVEGELNKLISQLNKNKIELNVNTDNLRKNLKDAFNLDGITKSAYSSAKVFENEMNSIGDTIGKIREKSERKNRENNALQEAKEVNLALKEQYKLEEQMVSIRAKADYNSSKRYKDEELSQAKAINKALEDNYKSTLKEANAQKQVQQEIQKQIKLLEIKKQGMLSKNSKTDTSDVDKAISKYKELDNISMKDLRNEISYINAELKESSSSAEGFIGKITSSLRGIGIYVDVGDIFRGIINGAKEAIQYTVDVENSMIDLRRIIDMSDSQAQKFQESMHGVSVSLASSNADMIETTANFAKLGYNLQDAETLASTATKYNFSADINDINNSTSTLISTMKAFKLEAKDAMSIGDGVNKVSNDFAVSANQINDGLLKSSATLSAFGNDLKESVAMITAGTEIIQNGDVVGTALKSSSARITTNENALKWLKNFNISLEDQNGNLKSTYKLLDEIAPKLNELQGATKASAMNDLFGKQNISSMLAIINNIDNMHKVMDDLSNSTGSVDSEFNRYLDSTQAKTTQLKENLGGLYSQFVNSDMTKGTVDGLNLFITSITGVISKLGAIPTIITTVVTSFALFNSKFSQTLNNFTSSIPVIGNWINKLNTSKTQLQTVANAQQQQIIKLQEMKVQYQNAGMSTTQFNKSLGILQGQLALTNVKMLACKVGALALQGAMTMGLSVAVDFIIGKFSDLINTQERVAESNQDFLSSLKGDNNTDNTQELLNNYKILETQLSTLKNGTEEYKSKEEELQSVQEQLLSIYPNVNTILDENTGKKKLNADATQSLIDKDKELQKAKANGVLADNGISDLKDIKDQIRIYQEYMDEVKQANEKANNGETKAFGSWGGYASDLSNEAEEYKTKLMALQGALSILGDENENYKGALDLINGALTDNTNKTESNTNSKKNNEEATNTLKEAQEELSSSGELSAETLSKLGMSADEAKEAISDLNEESSDSNGFANSIEDATKQYIEVSQSIKDLKSYVEELNKAQEMTPELASKIAEKYPDVGSAILDVGDCVDFLNGKIQEQADIQQQAFEIMIGDDENFYQQKIANNSEFQNAYNNFLNSWLSDGQNSYNVDLSNYKTLNELKSASQDGLGSAIESWLSQFVGSSASGYADDFANFKSFAEAKASILDKLNQQIAKINANLNANIDAINKATSDMSSGEAEKLYGKNIGKLEKVNEAIQEVDTNFNGIGGQMKGFSGGSIGTSGGSGSGSKKGSGGGSKGSSGQSDAEKWTDKIKDLNSSIDIDRYADLNSQLDILDNHFTDNKNSLDGLTEGTKAYHDKQKEQIDIMKEQASTYSLLAGSYATERDELKQNLSQYGILTDATGKLTNAEAKLQYQQDLANDMSGNTEAEYNAKKKQIDAVKELEGNIKRYREVTESEIPKCTQKWDELNNTIIKTQREQLQAMMDDLASALETKYSKAKEEELQKVEDWYSQRKENLESEYQQDLKSLQDEKQSIVDEYDEQIKKLQAQLDELNDDSDNKQAKLSALKAELALWGKDTSVFSKKKQEELNQSIKDLELEIQKDNLQKEIDALKEKQSVQEDSLGTEIDNLESAHDDELDELEKSYDERKQETEDHYDKLLDEQSRYNEASKLMMSNSQEEILELLQSKSEDWKNVGSLLGENFADGLRSQVEQVMSDLSSLTGGTLGKNNSTSNNNSYTSKENNMATSSGNSNSKSDSINGKSYTVDDSGNISSQYALTNEEIKKILAGYESGGRTPSNISDNGALALLHKNEKILNSEDTNTFDKAMTIVNTDLKNFIDKFNNSHNNTLNGYNNLDVFGNTTDLNSMANRAMNNTTNNNSNDNSTIVQMDVNIVNNNLQDVAMNEKNIEKVFRKVIKNDGRRFK